MIKINHKALPKTKARSSGFSLIELMIAVALIGILAAVAFPQYGNYVKTVNRADGAMGLMLAVDSLERCKATTYSYSGCTLPPHLEESPEKHYTISISEVGTSDFLLEALPQGNQANDADCASFTISHLAVRASSPGPAGEDVNGCWS